ncbi:MAG: hypothetical protein ACJ77K_11935 [Bacteroidia bacterium]|jgi:hypothetical protein
MKTKRFVLYVFALLCYLPLISQTDQEHQNLEKYWRYRERLKNFVVVGDCQGCSLPSKGRGVAEDGADFNGTAGDPNDEGDLDFPDQTIRLEHYIAVLATEYKLLPSMV